MAQSPERKREYQREYHAKHREAANAKRKQQYYDRVAEGWKTPRPEDRPWATHYKSRYGITLSDFERMNAEQFGLCKICKSPPTRRYLSVDHDHITGKVRGLVCQDCNIGLSKFKDNPNMMDRAIKYLKGEL